MVISQIILFFIFSSFANCSQLQTDKVGVIGDYIDLTVSLNKDTVSFVDDLCITLNFFNKTNTEVAIYPTAFTALYIPAMTQYFVHNSMFIINSIQDFTKPQIVSPNSSYSKSYIVDISILSKRPLIENINSLNLSYGNNVLKLKYRCSKLEGKNKKYNRLYGELESQEFQMFLKD